MDTAGDELLSLDEAAQFLGISKPTLYRLLGSGHLRGIKVGRQWRFRRVDVSAYMDRSPVEVALPRTHELEQEIAFFDRELDKAGASKTIDSGAVEETEPEIVPEPLILAHRIMQLAITMRASDIHIEPARQDGAARVVIRYRVDGRLQEVHAMPGTVRESLTLAFKTLADLNTAERRLPMDGRIPLRYADKEFDMRIATAPSILGETIVIRILDRTSMVPSLDKLLFTPEDKVRVRALIHQPNGIFIGTGPTGSGKTTTLYACLRDVASPDVKTITIEDPVETLLPDTVQMQVDKRSGLTFPGALRSMIRQDPDVIYVGEVRDTETARIVAEASLTGHMVMTTLHTNDAPTAIARLLGLGIEPHIVAATVIGALAQRLAGRICENCKQEAPAGKFDESWLGYIRGLAAEGNYDIPADAKFYEGVGCDACRGRGYRGRIPLYELMEMNEAISGAILRSASPDEIEALALQCGMRTLFADGVRKAVEGYTTIDEVLRVTATTL